MLSGALFGSVALTQRVHSTSKSAHGGFSIMGRIPRTFDRFENSDGRPVISLGLVSTGDGEMALESGIGLSGELPVPELRELGDDEAERLFEELIGATEKLAKALRRKAVRKVIDLPGLKELARHFRDNHDFSDFMECHTLRKLLGLPDLLDDLLEEVPESAKPAAEIAALRQAADRLKARQAEEAVVDDIFFVPLVGSKKDVAAVKAALREAVVKVLKEKQL
ncbi:MAG: hypothetical protein J5J00_02500, partial [Deltaproteobacteria bacterium]|nr:hypothetical protein [Deltaproteobacteria bacterium]